MTAILSITCLFGQGSIIVKQQEPDEIEKLVNSFLLDQETLTSDKKIQNRSFHSKIFFVQVFAFSEKKPMELIQKIRQKGYRISIQNARRNNKQVNLLLVGPFRSEKDVNNALSELRMLSQGAFIYVVK